MFSINTSHTIEECINLEGQVSEMSEQMMELEQIIRVLGSLSCMEEPIAQLKSQLQNMDEEHYIMRQMMQGLNKISLYYIKCENRICDNGEQSTRYYPRQDIGVNDLSGWKDLLMKYNLE